MHLSLALCELLQLKVQLTSL